MSKILTVFGATGQQGTSVINHVLNDPSLSQTYKIRAITRDISSAKAQELSKLVEVVHADVTDRASLEKALSGSHTIFAMTTPDLGPNALEVEFENGKRIADVAVQQGVQYIIFSTLPAVSEITGGKYTKVTPFDAKAKIERYIRGLQVKSAFYSPGSFMENFQGQPFLAPVAQGDGTWVMSRVMDKETKMPLIDAVGDGGKFVGAMLAEPDKYAGKTFCAANGWYSHEEICAALSKSTGKSVVYKQISIEEFGKSLAFLPGTLGEILVEGFGLYEEFGYWGPGSEKEVEWARKNVRGRLSTFEEFLERNPFHLA